MRPVAGLAVAVAAASVCVAGCSRVVDGTAVAAPAAAHAPVASGAPSRARPSSGARRSSGAHAVPVRSLKSQLLTLADLPPGWHSDTSPDSGGTGGPSCMRGPIGGGGGGDPLREADASFAGGADVPFLQEHLGDFGSAASAGRILGATAKASDRCRHVSFRTGGTRISGTMNRLSVPKLGDRTVAWSIDFVAQGIKFGMDVLETRKGSELALIIYGTLGVANTDEVLALARTAVARMP